MATVCMCSASVASTRDHKNSANGRVRRRGRSGEGGRRHEPLELALQQPRERERRQVAVLRTDDLHADGQPGRREAARRCRRRQIGRARVAGPEQVIGHGHARAVDRHRALVPLGVLVVRKGRDAGHGTEQQVVGGEELRPRQPHPVARLAGGEPVAVRRHGGARRARVVALVVGRERVRDVLVLFEVRVGLPVGGGRAQEPDVDAPRLGGVDGRARPLVDLRLLPAQELAERGQPIPHVAVHRKARRVEHQRHPEVTQTLGPRRAQPQLPARGVEGVGPGHHGQREREIVAAAGQRPHDVDVDRRRLLPGQRLARARHDAPRRLVAVDAAEVRRVADGRADVAARLQRGEPGRERRRRAAGRPARRARDVPGIVRRAVDRVEALPVGEEERHVGLAEEHGAGAEQAIDNDRVPRRDVGLVGRHAPRRRQARDVVRLLDRHGHAVQRPPGGTPGQRAIGRAGPRPRAREVADDHGVQRVVVFLDARVAVAYGDAATARAAAGRARHSVAGATRRERQHVEAMSALIGGETARGLDLVAEHVAEFPRDALLVNQAGSAIGFAGGRDREQQRAVFLERLAPAYGDDWWFQSALAFTYHEMDRFKESRRLSERSLAQYPRNANASHNLAHIYFETLDNDGGAAFLGDWLATYDPRASFHCHLAWHLAMFELHRGRYARAQEIFQRDILNAANPRLAMIDGAALLWRFRLDGQPDAPLAWRSLADLAAKISRPGFVFGEVHAALAYAACGDDKALVGLIEGLRALDAKGHAIAGTVALPMVQGVAAFVAGDHAGALAQLEPVQGELHRVGGSHAQWELFEEPMVACYLALERFDAATRLVRRRLARRASPRDLRWVAQATSR